MANIVFFILLEMNIKENEVVQLTEKVCPHQKIA